MAQLPQLTYEPLYEQQPTLQFSEIDSATSPAAAAAASESRVHSPLLPNRYDGVRFDDQDIVDATNEPTAFNVQGLGLQNSGDEKSVAIKRVPVGSRKEGPSPGAFSPQFDANETTGGVLSQVSTVQGTPFKRDNDQFVNWPSLQSSRASLRQQGEIYRNIPSDTDFLQGRRPFGQGCPTNGDILKTQWGWYRYAIIFLAIFSTLFSGIFLGIALRKPRWNGLKRLPLETATLLSALFSKLIELSFACVFVATLGQILSRKAFAKRSTGRSGGISIAEMNMRLWILQPGTLLTHWTGAWFALKTTLGVVVLLAAFAAALYITAAEALVSPKLSFGKNETRDLVGKFNTMYANTRFLQAQCETPVTKSLDNDKEGEACMQIKHAGQGYRNFETWMIDWDQKIHSAVDLSPPEWRPPPVAMMFDNTTVQGQWIFPSAENMTLDSERYGRLVHNITLAMPHANVVHAVRDPRNRILQPEELRGDGEYYVQAAVPAPILNVLCVGMTDDEVEPMIANVTTSKPNEFPFATSVDDVFGFNKIPDGQVGDQPPYFPKKPEMYNTVLNITTYGQKAIYLLSASPSEIETAPYTLCALRSALYPYCTTAYHVAQSGSELSVHCNYGLSNDSQNSLPYSKFNENAPTGLWNVDWPQVGFAWATAVALSQGVSNANASIARTLLKMTPKYNTATGATLDPRFPTLSEGFGVLAGSTLLIASDGSPFAHMWNYTGRSYFEIPQDQYFASLLSYKDYASGNSAPWQGIFYIVLFAVFLLNLFCLCYLLWKFYTDGEVTDYTEPQNLFALAINSPPSHTMSGSCGSGPDGDMLRKKWTVDIAVASPDMDESPHRTNHIDDAASPAVTGQLMDSHPHFYVRCSEDNTDQKSPYAQFQPQETEQSYLRQRKSLFAANSPGSSPYKTALPYTAYQPAHRPSRNIFTTLWNSISLNRKRPSTRTFRPRSVADTRYQEAKVEESPALEQWKRLTGR